MVKITVKWGTRQFDAVEVAATTTPDEFKSQLQLLTSVPVERQKIMGFTGGLLKGVKPLGEMGLKEGMRVMMVGTAAVAPESAAGGTMTAAGNAAGSGAAAAAATVDGHQKRPVFLEEMTAVEKARLTAAGTVEEGKGVLAPAGIVNLGNTCYMNAVLQLIRRADVAVQEICKMAVPDNSNNPHDSFIRALKRFYTESRAAASAVSPFNLVAAVRLRWPQFATQRSNGEGFAQQDAEEFLSEMLQALCEQSTNFESLFSFNLDVKLVCRELEGATPVERNERNRILSCFTTGAKPVDHMMQGIKLSLNEEVTKHCEELGRDSVFERATRLASLPEYLLVQFVRFEWKAANSFSRTESSKTKVCRRIQYPMDLDVYEIASDSLKKELEIPRHAWSICGDPDVMRKKAADSMVDEKKGENNDDEEEEVSTTELCAGHYELVASVSHKGRSADSGHYVGWAQKRTDNNDIWFKFDDDRVSEVRIRDVDMCGGRSDFHISIILLYRKKTFEATATQVGKAAEEAEVARAAAECAAAKIAKNRAD